MLLIGGDFWFDGEYYAIGLLDLLARITKYSKDIIYKFSTPSEYFAEVYKANPETKSHYKLDKEFLLIVGNTQNNDGFWISLPKNKSDYYNTKIT